MNKSKVISQLQHQYPGKNILCLPEDSPLEIICEVEPTNEHFEFNTAIAVIDRSAPHYHKVATELYTVLKGEVTLTVDEKEHILKAGESFTIEPGKVHFATGNESWIKCDSKPGWKPEDHFLI